MKKIIKKQDLIDDGWFNKLPICNGNYWCLCSVSNTMNLINIDDSEIIYITNTIPLDLQRCWFKKLYQPRPFNNLDTWNNFELVEESYVKEDCIEIVKEIESNLNSLKSLYYKMKENDVNKICVANDIVKYENLLNIYKV